MSGEYGWITGDAITVKQQDGIGGSFYHSHPVLRRLFYIILFRSSTFVQEPYCEDKYYLVRGRISLVRQVNKSIKLRHNYLCATFLPLAH